MAVVHTRSVLVVGAADWYSEDVQDEIAWHCLSVVLVGACNWNCVSASQFVRDEHTRSEVLVGACDSYSHVALQLEIALQTGGLLSS